MRKKNQQQKKHLIKVLFLSTRSFSWIEFTCRRWSALVMSTLRSALTSSSCWAKWVLHNDSTYAYKYFFVFALTVSGMHSYIHTDTVILGNVLCLSLIKWNGQWVLPSPPPAFWFAEICATSSSVSALSNYRLQSVTCLLETLSLPPADEKSNNIHNSFCLFGVSSPSVSAASIITI